MGKSALLLLACALLISACASSALRQDCLERQKKVQRVAAIAPAEMSRGLTTNEVRALLGEPDEIITAKRVGDFDIWKYYVYADCQAHLGISAPTTELFFINGRLVNWTTYAR